MLWLLLFTSYSKEKYTHVLLRAQNKPVKSKTRWKPLRHYADVRGDPAVSGRSPGNQEQMQAQEWSFFKVVLSTLVSANPADSRTSATADCPHHGTEGARPGEGYTASLPHSPIRKVQKSRSPYILLLFFLSNSLSNCQYLSLWSLLLGCSSCQINKKGACLWI